MKRFLILAILLGSDIALSGTTVDVNPVTVAPGSFADPIPVAHGGSGVTSSGAAAAALGSALSGANSDITSLSGLTTPLSVAQGGTAAATASAARTALGAAASATTLSTTAPLTGGGDLSSNRTLSMPAATNSVNGYLTSADHTTFAAAAPSARSISTTAPLTGGGDLSANRTLSLPAATGSVDGYLGHGDWATFNGKQPAISATGGSVLFSGGGSAVSGDNANFFYDAANRRLGLGTTTPSQSLDVYNGNIRLSNQGSLGGNPGYVEFDDTSGNSIKIQAPATTATHTLVLPTNHPTAIGQVLSATGTTDPYQLSWEDAGITLDTLYSHQQNTAGAHQVAAVFCSAADGNIDVVGGGSPTCDGLSPFGGTAILTAQTDPTQNGLWSINFSGAWQYDPTWGDSTGGCNLADGDILSVRSGGTVYGNTVWQVKCVGGNATFTQIPTAARTGTCTVASTTLSTTAANLTCAGIPASTAVSVRCNGNAAFSTPTANGLYCRATGTANQIACNTTAANTTAMAYSCEWVKP